MGPKVEAVCRFVETTGDIAAIGSLEDLERDHRRDRRYRGRYRRSRLGVARVIGKNRVPDVANRVRQHLEEPPMSAGTAAKNGHADRLDPVAWPRRGSAPPPAEPRPAPGRAGRRATCWTRSASTSTSESLRETPRRMAGAYAELLTPSRSRRRRSPTTAATTSSSSRAASRSTRSASTTCCRSCGVAHVGYLPGERIVGLSKLARVVELLRPRAAGPGAADDAGRRLARARARAAAASASCSRPSTCACRCAACRSRARRRSPRRCTGCVRDDPRTRQEFLALTGRTEPCLSSRHARDRRRAAWPAPRRPRRCATRASTGASS